MTPKILTCHKSLTWQRFYLSCIVSMTRYMVASCLDNLERTACLPISTAYILRSALNQQTSQCGKSYFHHEVYLKANQILLIKHASDAIIASTDAKMFCQSDTVQLSSHLKISFSSFRRDYDNFLMAYFHHWNTWLGNINKKLSLVKSRCKKFRIQDWG